MKHIRHKKTSVLIELLKSYKNTRNGTPGGIRTPDLSVRSRTLYPTELRAHMILTTIFVIITHIIMVCQDLILKNYNILLKNAFVLSFCGLSMTCSGVPSSAITPSFMNMILSETFFANSIS